MIFFLQKCSDRTIMLRKFKFSNMCKDMCVWWRLPEQLIIQNMFFKITESVKMMLSHVTVMFEMERCWKARRWVQKWCMSRILRLELLDGWVLPSWNCSMCSHEIWSKKGVPRGKSHLSKDALFFWESSRCSFFLGKLKDALFFWESWKMLFFFEKVQKKRASFKFY